uniref:Dynactin subunit 5 n=1 Tax=Parastrongyloides trichosuri TaxID=131310 RepID=A0A0N4ZWU2_PARTI
MTELPRIYYKKDDYFETTTGNRIAKNCSLSGSVNLILNGKVTVMDRCTLRGDLNMIRIGKFTVIKEDCTIRPSYKLYKKGLMVYTNQIGDNVFIEENCIIMSIQMGAYVFVGKNSVIGRGVHIKECCQILPNTVIASNATFPPFSVIGGNPAKVVGETPKNFQYMMVEMTQEFYEKFTAKQTGQL